VASRAWCRTCLNALSFLLRLVRCDAGRTGCRAGVSLPAARCAVANHHLLPAISGDAQATAFCRNYRAEQEKKLQRWCTFPLHACHSPARAACAQNAPLHTPAPLLHSPPKALMHLHRMPWRWHALIYAAISYKHCAPEAAPASLQAPSPLFLHCTCNRTYCTAPSPLCLLCPRIYPFSLPQPSLACQIYRVREQLSLAQHCTRLPFFLSSVTLTASYLPLRMRSLLLYNNMATYQQQVLEGGNTIYL